ncbi:hypothetical protein HK405_000943, partial [Cladochytrium tenue]
MELPVHTILIPLVSDGGKFRHEIAVRSWPMGAEDGGGTRMSAAERLRALDDGTAAVVFSCIAALVTRAVMQPVDTIKTRLQAAGTSYTSSNSSPLLAAVRSGGLYRGLSVSLALSAPALAVYLATYDAAKSRLLAIAASAAVNRRQSRRHADLSDATNGNARLPLGVTILVHGSAAAAAESVSG